MYRLDNHTVYVLSVLFLCFVKVINIALISYLRQELMKREQRAQLLARRVAELEEKEAQVDFISMYNELLIVATCHN